MTWTLPKTLVPRVDFTPAGRLKLGRARRLAFHLTLSLGLATIVSGLTANSAHAAAWTTENHWSEQFEKKFSDYIRNLDLKIFSTPGHDWSGIPTDCADAAYTLRTIFAFENRLPVKFSTWKGPVTNDTNMFDDIADPVKRARKFIAYVNTYTNTRTLVDDTYPIAIRRGVVRPGTLFLHPQGDSQVPLTYRAGHVYYIQKVPDNGIIRYISSTVPAAVRDIDPLNGIIFSPMGTDGGYRTWVWPDSNERPNQSMMQFKMGGWHAKTYRDTDSWDTWINAIIDTLKTRDPSAEEQFKANRENLEIAINKRIAAVNKGWRYYLQNYAQGQCMSAGDYDSHSTPTRDVKIQMELQYFMMAADRWMAVMPYREDLYAKTRFLVAAPGDLPGISRPIYVNIHDLKHAFLDYEGNTTISISEPEHHPLVRWGLQAQGRWPCPQRAKSYVGGDRVQH